MAYVVIVYIYIYSDSLIGIHSKWTRNKAAINKINLKTV